MSGPQVKICGVRTAHHARVAASSGADMVGLIFAPSRRQVTVAEACAITGEQYDPRPRFVGVFVNADPVTIDQVAADVGLDMAQLSGDESPEVCARLTTPYSKVVHVHPGMTAPDVLHIAHLYTGAAIIVLDSGSRTGPSLWGGSGVTIDRALAAQVVRTIDRPVLLAGGLLPNTVGEAVQAVRPWGVDVSSGVETDGEKDDAKIEAFITGAKGVPAHEQGYR